MPGGGSGIEQEIVDHISRQFDGDPSVVLSTVNPDWYVLCNIHEINDQMSGQIRYNGTVTIKTGDGQVVSTVAVQKYNQDFSLQPGAPLNKKLVDGAAREVISGISDRAVEQIKQAVAVELQTREQIIQAEALANEDKYAEAVDTLGKIGPDTVHFKQVQKRIATFVMENKALTLVTGAQAKAKSGRYGEAISMLREVDPQSKRHKLAVQLIGRYQAMKGGLASSKLAKNKTGGAAKSDLPGSAKAKLNALEVEKQALLKEKQAIESKEAAIKKQADSGK
jgi:hypothetical protein